MTWKFLEADENEIAIDRETEKAVRLWIDADRQVWLPKSAIRLVSFDSCVPLTHARFASVKIAEWAVREKGLTSLIKEVV